jgi:hypothetical protein
MNPEFGLCSSKKGYKNPGPHVRHVTHCIPRIPSVISSADFEGVRHARVRVTPLECWNFVLDLR